MLRRHHTQFFPLPNESNHSGSGVTEYAGYGLLRFETREAIGIGQPTLFSHARFISYLSKNKQEKNLLSKRMLLTSTCIFYPLGKEMPLYLYGIGVSQIVCSNELYSTFRKRVVVPGTKNPQEIYAGSFHVLNADYAIKEHVCRLEQRRT
jgi:hypothetical protein